MEVPGLAGQEPQGGAGHHHGHHSHALHLLLDADIWHDVLQEDLPHPMDGLTHDQHHHHGHHLHLLDIHVLLHRLAVGHRVPRGGWPSAGPVDRHVEAGLSLLHHPQGHGQAGAGHAQDAGRVSACPGEDRQCVNEGIE